MPFDPNILLQIAQILSQRRGQDIQNRNANPSFSKVFQQGLAQGLGQAPGQFIGGLGGELMASSRQTASFAHEDAAQRAQFAQQLKMEDLHNPEVQIDPSMLGQPGFPSAPPPLPPDGVNLPAPDAYTPAPQPQHPATMRADALRSVMEMNRPRYEREIEQMRQAGEMSRTQEQGRNALALEDQRSQVNMPYAWALQHGFAGDQQPTGFGGAMGGGAFSGQPVPVDERAAAIMSNEDLRRAMQDNTAAYQKGSLDVRQQNANTAAGQAAETARSNQAKETQAKTVEDHKTAVSNREADLKDSGLTMEALGRLHGTETTRLNALSAERAKYATDINSILDPTIKTRVEGLDREIARRAVESDALAKRIMDLSHPVQKSVAPPPSKAGKAWPDMTPEEKAAAWSGMTPVEKAAALTEGR